MVSDNEIVFSESLLRDEEQVGGTTGEEVAEAKKYCTPDEKLLAIIDGSVDGESSFNRLALSDRRIIFYQRTRTEGFLTVYQKKNAISLDYGRVDSVQGRKGIMLGEVSLSTKERIIRFKNVDKRDVDRIAGMISRMRDRVATKRF